MSGPMTRDLLRYGRQMRVPGIGAEGQARIAQLEPVLSSSRGLARQVERAYLVAAGTQAPKEPSPAEPERSAASDDSRVGPGFMPGPGAVLEGAWNALDIVRTAVRAGMPCDER